MESQAIMLVWEGWWQALCALCHLPVAFSCFWCLCGGCMLAACPHSEHISVSLCLGASSRVQESLPRGVPHPGRQPLAKEGESWGQMPQLLFLQGGSSEMLSVQVC